MSSKAQIPGLGPCGELEAMDVNASAYQGTWYGYATYPYISYPHKCRIVTVISNSNGTVSNVLQQLSDTTSNVLYEQTALLMAISGPNMTFIAPESSPYYKVTLRMISTDYVSYVIKGFCSNVGPSSLTYCWIETRERHLSQDVLDRIQQVLKERNLPQQYFVLENQDDNCPDHF